VAYLFGVYDRETYLKTLFALTYCQHGGSGLHLSLSDVYSLPLDELEWWTEELHSRRRAEAEAIRRASKKK